MVTKVVVIFWRLLKIGIIYYTPATMILMVGDTGLEPVTPAMWTRCSPTELIAQALKNCKLLVIHPDSILKVNEAGVTDRNLNLVKVWKALKSLDIKSFNRQWRIASGFVAVTLYPNFRMGGKVEKCLTGIYLLKKFVTNFDLAPESAYGTFANYP